MDKLIEFFIENSGYLNIVLAIGLLLVGFFIVIILVGFIQGRKIGLWPPSIGERVNNSEINVSPTTSIIETYSGYSADYENAHKADAEAIESATRHFDFLGVSSQFLYTREGFIDFLSNRAIEFRFLLLDPTSSHASIIEEKEGIPLRRNIVTSAHNLLDMRIRNHSICIKFYNQEPRFRIIATDRKRCFVSYYSATQNNPQICFDNRKNGRSLLVPFLGIFDDLWKNGTDVNRDYLHKITEDHNN